MRLIAVEEHVATPEVLAKWRSLDPQWRDLGFRLSSEGSVSDALQDLGTVRLAAMEASGIDVQVLSLTTLPGRDDPLASHVCELQCLILKLSERIMA
jgi:uncharacterized protein